jgi:hypothetical protein
MRIRLYRFLELLDIDLLMTRSSEAAREIGVLWLVFSVLDKLVVNELTVPWVVANGAVAVGTWVLSLYIEIYGNWRKR